jgi:hypothetical protein
MIGREEAGNCIEGGGTERRWDPRGNVQIISTLVFHSPCHGCSPVGTVYMYQMMMLRCMPRQPSKSPKSGVHHSLFTPLRFASSCFPFFPSPLPTRPAPSRPVPLPYLFTFTFTSTSPAAVRCRPLLLPCLPSIPSPRVLPTSDQADTSAGERKWAVDHRQWTVGSLPARAVRLTRHYPTVLNRPRSSHPHT